ncbi:MAG: AraC family transcriptional regulator [Bacteroidota bacterium]
MKPIFQQIAIEQEQSIIAFYYNKDIFEAPWHFHPQHELIYVKNSTGTKFVGDYVGSYLPGELVLLRSNLPHSWKNYKQADNRAQSVVVQWEKGIFAQVPETSKLFKMLRTAAKGILFEADEVRDLIPMMTKMLDLEADDLYLQLLALLLKLADCKHPTLSAASFTDDMPTEYGSRIAKVHDFVELHYARKIYLKELAELVNLSEHAFSRFFSKVMGRPFFQFLNEYRVNNASRMLIETDRSVAEIGYASGYESLTFFYKQFAKFKGVSPLKYRKRYRG